MRLIKKIDPETNLYMKLLMSNFIWMTLVGAMGEIFNIISGKVQWSLVIGYLLGSIVSGAMHSIDRKNNPP